MTAAPHPRMHGLTHVQGGPDPIPGLVKAPGGDTLDAIIEGLDPAGWWKLDESAGSVAHDSSGNGLDLTADTGPPLWAAAAGPPGTQTADFNTGTGGTFPTGTAARVARSWAAITGDFTAGLWVRVHTAAGYMFMGQGNPARSGGAGWELGFYNASTITTHGTQRLYAEMKGTVVVDSLNPWVADTWYFVAMTYTAAATTFKLYVNGLLQGTSAAFTYVPVTGSSPLWIGHDAGLGGNPYAAPVDFRGSYAFYMPSVLTGAQLLDVYNSAVLPAGADAGKALLATGLGGTEWDFAVEVDAVRYRGIVLGSNLSGTDNGDHTVTVDAAGSDPATDTQAWMPLTTVVGGTPDLVWDATDSLIPTLTTL